MRTLLDSPYFHVSHDQARDILIIRRTAEPFLSAEAINEGFSRVFTVVKGYVKKPMLVDLRDSPGNNDPRFESALRPNSARLRSMFSVACTLVRTATGRLQVQRIARERGVATTVFSSEAEALAYLADNRGEA